MLAYTTCGEIVKAVDAFHAEIELFVSKLFEHTTYAGMGKCLLEHWHNVSVHFGFLFTEREVRVQLVFQSILSK